MADSKTVEVRLRAAVESSPSGLLMIDAQGVIVLVNREVERLFGYSREELLGKPVELLVPDRHRDVHPGLRTRFATSPSVRSMGEGRDLHGRRKDGTEVPVEIGLTPVATAEGMFVISSVVDISARRRAEQRFRVAVESSPNGMVMVDEAGTIVLVNQEVERLFGYTRAEILGKPIDILVPDPFRGAHPGYRKDFFRNPAARKMGAGRELFGQHKDGQRVPIEIGLNPIETDEGLFVLSSIVDISERRKAEDEHRKLEDQLRQAQKLEAVGRLAGGVAHDFNNILGMIVGYTELARSACGPDAAKDLDEALSAARRGKEVIERILRFSRRNELKLQPIDLPLTVEDAARLLRATLPASVQISRRVIGQIPRVLADATSVHQVVMNLVTNAAAAMPRGGTVDIRLEPFYVRDSVARRHPSLREGPHVLLVVEDTGVGMDEQTRARALEPFFTTKDVGQGSGLGLSIVHGILQDHAGAMWLDSTEGRGTTVHCVLPVADSTEVPVPLESVVVRGTGQRVFVVDDEPALATVGARQLERLGYVTKSFIDPHAALQSAEANPDSFDVLLTDLSMPQFSGLELARRVSALRPGLPIVLVTGYMEDLTPEMLAEAGVTEVLLKPIDQAQLAGALARALSKSQASS